MERRPLRRRPLEAETPRQIVYTPPRHKRASLAQQRTTKAIRQMQPLQLDDGSNHLSLRELLVFTDDGATVLSFVGANGTLNVRLEAKSVAALTRLLVSQLERTRA